MRRSRKPVWAFSPSGVRIPPSPLLWRRFRRPNRSCPGRWPAMRRGSRCRQGPPKTARAGCALARIWRAPHARQSCGGDDALNRSLPRRRPNEQPRRALSLVRTVASRTGYAIAVPRGRNGSIRHGRRLRGAAGAETGARRIPELRLPRRSLIVHIAKAIAGRHQTQAKLGLKRG
jgi:hypothetical protein